MDKKTAIETYHPWVILLFFMEIIVLGGVFFHPIYLIMFLIGGAFLYAGIYDNVRLLKQGISFLSIVFLVTFMNGLWNHQGITILFYLGDNPVTKEALLYGGMNGVYFYSIFLWFACFSKIMTEDKIHYLFGSIVPVFALIFSMVLGMIPKIKHHISQVRRARRMLKGTPTYVKDKLKEDMSVWSMTATWMLEHSVDTADSMKYRGYGKGKRTCFHMYRYEMRDCILTLLLSAILGESIISYMLGNGRMLFFPMIQKDKIGFVSVLCYSVLCFMPEIIQKKEDIVWRRFT